MKDLIYMCDILSPIPGLKIKKENRFHTILGGVISIIAFILITVTSVYFTNIMLSRTEKSITFNVNPADNPSFNLSQTPIIFIFTNNLGFPIQNSEKYFSIHSAMWNISILDNKTMTTVPTYLNFEKCDINKHFAPEYKKLYENMPFLSEHICIVPGQKMILDQVFGSIKGFNFFSLFSRICTNNSALNQTCHDQSKIQRDLAGMLLNVKFPEHTFNHSNINNPGNLYLRSDIIPVGPSVFKKEIYTIRQVEYISDFGFIQESKTTQNYYYLSEYKESTDLSPGSNNLRTFVYVQISMDPKSDSYLRIFMKAQTLLANIGGLIKGVLTCCEILTTLFLWELYYIDLISALFNVNNKKMEEKMSNKMTILPIDEMIKKSDISSSQISKPCDISNSPQPLKKISPNSSVAKYLFFYF